MSLFLPIIYSPPSQDDPALAIAACRAEALGVYQAGPGADERRVRESLERLSRFSRKPFGVRLHEPAGSLLEVALSFARRGLEWIILDPEDARSSSGILKMFRGGGGRVLIEVRGWNSSFADVTEAVDGCIVKGCEAGGAVGTDSSWTLLHRALTDQKKPVYVFGGVGLHGAVACQAAGAAGMVLESQMLLLHESPLSAKTKARLRNVSADETILLDCPSNGSRFRVLGTATVQQGDGEDRLDPADLWRKCGWEDPDQQLLPAGQDVLFAGDWAKRYRNVSGVLRAFREYTRLPQHGGAESARYTLVQEVPEGDKKRAKMIAEAGACPILDLEDLSNDTVVASLSETVEMLGNSRWGIRISGSLSPQEMSARAAAVISHRPDFALVSGGSLEQVMALERAGISSFAPVASPRMVPLLLEQGIRRFVMRRGANGDTAAAEDLLRWESMVNALIEKKWVNGQESIEVLFADRPADDAALAAAAAMGAPLARCGVDVSILVAQNTSSDVVGSFSRARPSGDQNGEDRQTVIEPDDLQYRRSRPPAADIAIIGIGCVLPKAGGVGEYWRNILDSVNAITEIPKDRWDWRLYFDEDKKAEDKIYSKWGGFLDDILFDPMKYGIPPAAIRAIDPLQLMTLEVVGRALEDAGYVDQSFNRERTALILGASGGIGDVGNQYALRSEITRFTGELDAELACRLPRWTEDTFAGILLNVAAGRAANRFNFGGVNFTVDSACASSLTAVYQAVSELQTGRCDMAIAGGIDTVQGPFGYLCFSRTQALSPHGRCRTFDADADGIVISEGIAMVAMKRLEDAERDGDRIYAVVKGVGGSSDGRARSMTAPHPDGQIRALIRAYEMAGYSPATVGMFEAHGTGTVAGDAAELETVTRLLKTAGSRPKQSAIGSVKTLIGHTKATAGIAGMIKCALALYHQTLPPHANVEQPNSKLAEPDCPLYLLREPEPWIAEEKYPRRASVSAFGFGGTNFHVALEEYQGDFLPWEKTAVRDRWGAELLLWRAENRTALATSVRYLANAIDAGASPRLADLSFTLANTLPESGETAALIVAEGGPLGARLNALLAHLEDSSRPLPPGAYYTPDPLAAHGKVAIVFGGQGSQYLNMFRQLAVGFAEVRGALAEGDRLLGGRIAERIGDGAKLSRLIYPPALFSAESEAQAVETLTRTDVAQPAIGVVEAGIWQLLERFGVRADMAAGHSYGEWVALFAAGVLTLEDLLRVSEARGRFIVDAANGRDLGTMAAVKAGRQEVAEVLQAHPNLVLANHNTPTQSIISGPGDAIDAAIADLTARDVKARRLQVGAAFHSSLVAPARENLARFIDKLELGKARFPVYSNTTSRPHSDDPEELRQTLADHLEKPVEFVAEIEAMYGAGARVFIGLGPKVSQATLVSEILSDRPHRVVRVDDGEGGFKGLLHCLGSLMTEGIRLDLSPLFEGRGCAEIALDHLATHHLEPPPAHTWLLNGSGARPARERPPEVLTVETVSQRKQRQLPPSTDSAQPKVSPVPTTHTTKAHVTKAKESTMSDDPSAPQVPAGEPPPTPEPTRSSDAELVLSAYQQTMHQFLLSQERVMMAYLTGAHQPLSARTNLPARGSRVPRPALQTPRQASLPTLARPAAARAATPAAAAAAEAGAVPPPEPQPSRESTPQAVAPSAPAPVKQPDSSSESSPVSAPPRAEEGVQDLLLGIVEERTGYPRDMLDMDQNMEADLGIDSIKRVEIIGALLKSLPPETVANVEEASKVLNEEKTLRGIVGWLEANGVPAKEVAVRPFELTGTGDSIESRAPLSRWLMQARLESVKGVPLDALRRGIYLITDDETGVGEALEVLIRADGGTPVRIESELLEEPNRLKARIASLRQSTERFAGLIHLSPLSAKPIEFDAPLSAWKLETARNEKSLFALLQLLAEDLQASGRVIAASGMGGYFGRGLPVPGLTAQGGAVGCLKCLNEEWADTLFKAVDLDPKRPSASNADAVYTELRLPGGRIEVGYPEGNRTVFEATPAPLTQEESFTFEADSVVLVTGGARGITACTTLALAGTGTRLIIVGRSPAPGKKAAESARFTDQASLNRHLMERAKSADRKFKPVDIQREANAIIQARAIRASLAALSEAGASVEYRSVDMRSEDQVKALLSDIYERHGRLDAVIHGAGVVEDKPLVKKSSDSLDRVFDTKVDSAFLLARYLRPEKGLKFVVFFTSVAGRFGNSGQTDYGAANEAVNRLAWQLHHRWRGGVKVCAVNWGPWEGTRFGEGMVSPEIAAKFDALGVELVSEAQGCEFLCHELGATSTDVEIIAGLGPWEERERDVGNFRFESRHDRAGARTTFPLINGVKSEGTPGEEIAIPRDLDPSIDHYLSEHLLDGVPVLPAAAAVEWVAEAAQAACPDFVVTEVTDLRLLRGVRLETVPMALEAVVKIDEGHDSKSRVATVALRSRQNNSLPFYRGTVHLGESLPPVIAFDSTLRPTASPVDAQQAYRDWLFHGPCLQLIHRLIGIDQKGAIADVLPSDPTVWLSDCDDDSQWIFDPGMLDCVPQMAIVWAHVMRSESALPSLFGRVRRFGGQSLGPCRMYFSLHADQPANAINADVAFVDEAGRLRMLIEDFESASSSALVRLGGGWKGEIRV